MKNPKSYHHPPLSPVLLFFLTISLCLYRESTVVDAQDINETSIMTTTVDVGVILDVDTLVGKMGLSCLSMALSDFYSAHPNYKTRLVLHTRDAKEDVVDAASSAIDLMKNVEVQAIIGPQTSFQAEFVANIGNKTQVPIISFSATSPQLSYLKTPYFIRTTLNDSCQVRAIGDIIKSFGWREVVPVYEDTDYGNDLLPDIIDAIQESNAKAPYRSVVSPLATDSQILEELYKLKSMQTRVFIVHMSSSLGARLFMKIKEAEMMSKGYVWIITNGLTDLLGSMNSSLIESMQGVLGVKHYVPGSKDLNKFRTRWRRKFLIENPDADGADQLNVFGLWAYDSIQGLAMAVERVSPFSPSSSSRFRKPETVQNSTDLANIGLSQMGPKLLEAILATSFIGLSGEFRLVSGQLQSSAFQIVNVIGKGEREIGFWTPTHGISKTLDFIDKKSYSVSKSDFRAIFWPGDSTVVPKGWEIPTGEKKLRIGVPVKDGFSEFVKVEYDGNGAPKVTGFIIDVFKLVMDSLPYSVPYEFFPFANFDDRIARDYNDLVYQLYLQNYSAVVGDITIVANRSLYVDFTLPYTESGVAMIVPIKDDERKNAWIFLKPLTRNLWLTTGAFFILTGFVIWVLEHRINNDFRGSPSEEIGMMFWFAFSTLVFAQKEKMMSNLSRFVMIIWFFVVLVLTSSYTASFTSMLTVQQLQPTFKDVKDLIKSGEYVGYQRGSFVKGVMENLKFDQSKLRLYDTVEEYDDALSRGSQGGGVAAILEEIPYIKIFLSKYCSKYTMVGPTYQTAGFGFAFPKGSPLVPDISRAILNATEGGEIAAIEKAWFGQQPDCPEQGGTKISSDSLTLDSFLGLFLIAGIASFSSLVTFVIIFLRENKNILSSQLSVRQKLKLLAKEFDKKKPEKSKPTSKATPMMKDETSDCVTGNNVNINNDDQLGNNSDASFCLSPDVISQDGGVSSTEPNTPPPGREQPSIVEIT